MRVTLADTLAGRVPDGVHLCDSTETAAALQAACDDADWALAHLDGVRDKADALSAFELGFVLPDWWGENWDALDEALREPWPPQRLVVWDRPRVMAVADARILREILADAARHWSRRTGRFVVLLRG